MDILLSIDNFEPEMIYERIISETEMTWNMTQHSDREIPHFGRFSVMLRIFGKLENGTNI